MRALVCGISGQDGAYLAELLLAKGYQVIGTSRDASMASMAKLERLGIASRVHVESAALTDFRSVMQVLLKVEPDEVYNLAGQSSVGLSFEQPVETLESIAHGTLNVLEAIRMLKRPVRFYTACSGDCFGDTGDEAAHELTPFRPRSPYGVAKATAFWEVANYREAYQLFACSGLLFNHESPLRPARFVTRKVVEAAARIAAGSTEKLRLGDTAVTRDWGWAPDYVEAMWLMLQQERPADFVIATGESHSLTDFVAAAFRAVGLDANDHVISDASLYRPTDIRMSRGCADKAQRELGWVAKHRMHDVVAKMVEAEVAVLRTAGALPRRRRTDR